MNKYKYITLILLSILIILSCNDFDEKLIGHWHIEHKNISNSTFEDLPTIDIVNDSVAILGKGIYGSPGIGGYIDLENRIIYFGGECFRADFKFKMKNKKLYLNNLEDSLGRYEYEAIKCGKGCCNKQEEYFQQTVVDIDLPIIEVNQGLVKLDLWRQNTITIGLPKTNLQSHYGKEFRLANFNKFIEIEDLELMQEITKVKIPEKKRDSIVRVIYADKNVPIKLILNVISEWNKINPNQKNFLALREKEIKNSLSLWYKEIDIESLNSVRNLNLLDLIKKK